VRLSANPAALKQLRTKTGFSQLDLSDKIGVSLATWQRAEGEGKISSETLDKLKAYLANVLHWKLSNDDFLSTS
jgi:transcriptional regulator with XRE-family HTH domain